MSLILCILSEAGRETRTMECVLQQNRGGEYVGPKCDHEFLLLVHVRQLSFCVDISFQLPW